MAQAGSASTEGTLRMKTSDGERLTRRGCCAWSIEGKTPIAVSESSINPEKPQCLSEVVRHRSRANHQSPPRFFITLTPCPHLNAKHTVFGHVVSGPQILNRIAKMPVDAKDRPLSEIIISHCGELERRTEPLAVRSEAIPSSKAPINPPSARSPNHRGRKPPRHRSRSRATSSPHPRSISPTHQIRRRSDFDIDESRRGRSLSRTPPSVHDTRHGPRHHHHRRKRSPPPSRSRSPRHGSRSPHLRRRRSRSRSPWKTRAARPGRREREETRRRDEDQIARKETQRESGRWGRGDRDEVLKTSSSAYYGGNYNNGGSHHRRDERHHDGYYGDDGQDANGRYRPRDVNHNYTNNPHDHDDGGAEVKFKGRGSMKYRERKW